MTEEQGKKSRVTEDLTLWLGGNLQSGDRPLKLLFPKILQIARRLVGRGRPASKPEPAELANEGLIRMIKGSSEVRSREHFLSLLALHMRNSLIDQHRASTAIKRKRTPEEAEEIFPQGGTSGNMSEEVLMVREVLEELATSSPRTVNVISLKMQYGFSVEETASLLGVSKRTVNTEWTKAKQHFRDAFDAPSSD